MFWGTIVSSKEALNPTIRKMVLLASISIIQIFCRPLALSLIVFRRLNDFKRCTSEGFETVCR